MVKMLALFSLMAMAPLATANDLGCAIEGAGALDSTVNAAVYLWASTQRCDAAASGHSDIKCAIDVNSAIKSVTDMINIIVSAVNKCGDVNVKHAACGAAVGQLTSAAAGLGAGGAALAGWLKNSAQPGNIVVDATTTKVGKCVMNVKGVASGIFGAAGGIAAAKKGCSGDAEVCATNALQVISILSNLGSAIAHSVHYCGKGDTNADMSGDIVGLVAALDGVAAAGIAIEQNCKVEASRLYLAENEDTTPTTNNSMSIALAALLPVAAILGFVGGRRVQKKVARSSVMHLGEEEFNPDNE
jgi:hypothetical protein